MTLKKYYNKNLLLLRFRWGEDPTISLRLPPLMFNITWAKLINPNKCWNLSRADKLIFLQIRNLSNSDLTQPFTQLHNFGLLKFGLMRLNYLTFVYLIVNVSMVNVTIEPLKKRKSFLLAYYPTLTISY